MCVLVLVKEPRRASNASLYDGDRAKLPEAGHCRPFFCVERIAVIYVAHVVILICLKPSLPAIRLVRLACNRTSQRFRFV